MWVTEKEIFHLPECCFQYYSYQHKLTNSSLSQRRISVEAEDVRSYIFEEVHVCRLCLL